MHNVFSNSLYDVFELSLTFVIKFHVIILIVNMLAINRSSPFPIIQVFHKKNKIKFLYLVLHVSCLNAIS
jgi:hypothetical protein